MFLDVFVIWILITSKYISIIYMKEEKDIWEVIANILNSSASEKERQIFDEHIKKKDFSVKIFDILKSVRLNNENINADIDKSKIFANIQLRIKEVKQRRKIRFWQYAAAASMTLFIVAGFWLYMNLVVPGKSALISTTTPKGIKTEINLPDGSVVNLNAGSKLTYPVVFRGRNRVVTISGEGYFEVVHNKHHPFIVKTGSVQIKVLGTHFNIRDYKEEPTIFATLLEGSIQISEQSEDTNNENKLKLIPGQQFVLEKSSGEIKVLNVDADLYANWRNGQLYFDGKSFGFISHELERVYNINIAIQSDSLKRQIFSGIFNSNDKIYHVLDLMKRHHYFNYSNNEDSIFIFKNK